MVGVLFLGMAIDKYSQRLPINEGQGRNDAFYETRRKTKGRKVMPVKRPRRLGITLAQTLEGLRMENQDSKPVANYRKSKQRSAEWAKKSRNL